MNHVTLTGRLTATPELKSTANDINYCRFTVAVNRPYSKEEEQKADFINCVAWRQTAEFVTKYFTKGQMIAVEGAIQTGSYTNKDGIKVYTTDINVAKVHFCGSKSESGSGMQAQSAQTETAANPNYSSGTAADFGQAPSNDLPF